MSFQKRQMETDLIEKVASLQAETLENCDFTKILKYLNVFLNIHESIDEEDSELTKLWNDIIADILGAIYTGISGFYRIAMISMRSILEMACVSFYYYDHKVEYHMFVENDLAADKYVSTLVNDYRFFTSNYIHYFADDIDDIEVSNNAIANKLKKIYKDQCDVVHGRYKNLLKADGLSIKYDKILFDKFERMLMETMSIVSVMYILRFNKRDDKSLLELAEYIKVVEFNE